MARVATVTRLAFSIKEVAQYLGVPKSTVDGWVQRGVIPTLRIEGRVLIPREEFERWLEQRKVKA